MGELGAALALGIIQIIFGIVPYLAGRLGLVGALGAAAVYGLPASIVLGGIVLTALLVRAAPEGDLVLATPLILGMPMAYYALRIGQWAYARGQEGRYRNERTDSDLYSK